MSFPGFAVTSPSGLVSLIYEAALDASRWQAFLNAYAKALGARRAGLVLSAEPRSATTSFRWSAWPEGDVRLNADRRRTDDLYRTLGKAEPEGAIRIVDLLFPNLPDLGPVYTAFHAPEDVRHGLAGVFLRATGAASMIVAVRAEQDGPFGEPAMALSRALLPHLRQAALLQRELSSLRTRLAAFATYLDRSPFPFLLVDADGRLLHINAIARETVSLKDGIAITAGQFSVMSAKGQVVLINAIREVAGGIGGPLLRLDVQRPSGRPPYRLLVMSLPSSAATPPGVSQRAVAMLIIDREAGKELDPEILAELYSLTPTQARVTGRLAVGRSAEEIAREMGLSLETVRTHIRHVLSKTGTGRQGELIALILRTAPFCRL